MKDNIEWWKAIIYGVAFLVLLLVGLFIYLHTHGDFTYKTAQGSFGSAKYCKSFPDGKKICKNGDTLIEVVEYERIK